jgi:putative FmdB family regulatory protein
LPLYPYRCTQCGHRFEKIQSFKAKPEKKCPQCGGPLERVLTAPALNFKGAGWYVNDYAAKSNAPAEASSSDKEPKTKAKTESSGDKAAPPAISPAPAPTPSMKPDTTAK